MGSRKCPACDALLQPQEITDGWCESCGKRLPAFVQAAASAGPQRQPEAIAAQPAPAPSPNSPPATQDLHALGRDMLHAGVPPGEVEERLFEKGADRRTADAIVKEAMKAARPVGHHLRRLGRSVLFLGSFLFTGAAAGAVRGWIEHFHPTWLVGAIVLQAIAITLFAAARVLRRRTSAYWGSVGGGWWSCRQSDGRTLVWHEAWQGEKEKNYRLLPSHASRVLSLSDQEFRQWLDANMRG
jgi:hypothetical protein